MNRSNDRSNNLFVLDYDIPKGNISYTGLNSKINKGEISYSDIYALTAEDRFYNTGQAVNDINVTSETWKYEQKLLPNLALDAFSSFSMSKNDRTTYMFNFEEQDAYTESVLKKSVEGVGYGFRFFFA